MTKNWLVASFFTIVGFILSFVFSVYANEVRQIISSYIAISNVDLVFYIILVSFLLIFSVFGAYISIQIYNWVRLGVRIEEESLRFYKYPLILGTNQRMNNMTNISYSEITIHNCQKKQVNRCSLEIILKKDGKQVYNSKVLTGDATNPKEPNPLTVTLDGKGNIGFHPVAVCLDSFQAFLPNHSLGVAGKFTGPLIAHDEYEMFGKVIFDDKLGKSTSLGKINIPNDFLDKAEIPNDIQIIIDQGGFAVYVELFQNNPRAKFFGNINNKEINNVLQRLRRPYPNLDRTIEVNGTARNRPANEPAFRFM